MLIYILLAIIMIPGFILSKHKIWIGWTMSCLPLATFFTCFGHLTRSNMLKIPSYNTARLILFLFLTFATTFVISRFGRLDMAWNKVLPIIPLTISAISGVVMLLIGSYFISKLTKICKQILIAIGKETFVIMAFSQTIGMLLIHFLPVPSLIRLLIEFLLLLIIVLAKNYIKRIVINTSRNA